MRLYLIALQFLTIIPLPCDTRCQKEDLGRATACFPLVGLTVGGLLVGLNWLIEPWLNRSLTAALLITALAVVSGALHLDGLADVCDGLAARGSRERFLAIMKDSHVGAAGAVAVVLGILLKWQALAAVPAGITWQALLLFPILGRSAQVLALGGAKHARQDGLGAAIIQGMAARHLLVALGITLAACLLALPVKGMIALVAVFAVTLVIKGYFQNRLGGLTGDIIGCINEIAEIVALIVLSGGYPQ
ncbi:MAG: adenosylcobinamide-GDP ribazoletransferase [Desulfuromonadales bacterium]|nr:adenosylcobinamide-GDP ribazoletransferase [Desulfuromonadales bacterium]